MTNSSEKTTQEKQLALPGDEYRPLRPVEIPYAHNEHGRCGVCGAVIDVPSDAGCARAWLARDRAL